MVFRFGENENDVEIVSNKALLKPFNGFWHNNNLFEREKMSKVKLHLFSNHIIRTLHLGVECK